MMGGLMHCLAYCGRGLMLWGRGLAVHRCGLLGEGVAIIAQAPPRPRAISRWAPARAVLLVVDGGPWALIRSDKKR